MTRRYRQGSDVFVCDRGHLYHGSVNKQCPYCRFKDGDGE